MKIRTHSDIRHLILTTTRILRISQLGRPFSGVFTKAIRLDLLKGSPPKNWLVSIDDDGGNTHQVEQLRFMSNPHYGFDGNVTDKEDRIIKALYSVEHQTLAGNAEWALGIVTGNNSRHVSDTLKDGMEAIFRGSDISPFKLGAPRSFLHFDPSSFQQVAKEHLYRAPEKLIYKFISSSLAFAYDDQQRLTLNSANILIPRIPGLRIKVVLAFLNSCVFQYLFRKQCCTHKILRGDFEKFPFPYLSGDVQASIESLVDSIHAGKVEHEALQNLIFSAFLLSDDDIQVIRNTVEGRVNGTT